MIERDDLQLLRDFESCSIAPGGFHHREHVRVAWVLLKRGPLSEVLPRYAAALRRFADHAGASGLYHETITWAFLFAINERIRRLPDDHGWADFERAHPELTGDFRRFLELYYSPERLDSELARKHFLLPDRGATDSLKETDNARVQG